MWFYSAFNDIDLCSCMLMLLVPLWVKGQCIGTKAIQVLVNITWSLWHFTHNSLQNVFRDWSSMDNSRASPGNLSMQNGNGHKCLPAIDRTDKVIHNSSTALANSMWHNHIGFVIITFIALTNFLGHSNFTLCNSSTVAYYKFCKPL